MAKQLIINADDFGLSSSVNQAIIEAHEKGILTSTSLMVSGLACLEAIELAKQHPQLGVGLHLVLVCGQSVLPPRMIPHLVNAQGNFIDDPVQAGLTYQFNAKARRELFLEIRAQLEKFQQTGLPLSHLDGHLHLHVHPVVLNILKELASEFQIPFIRLPQEELSLNLAIDSRNRWRKILWSLVFGQLRRYGEKVLQSVDIHTADRVYGLLQTGKISEAYLWQLLPQIQASLVEIYAHPDRLATSINPTGPLELQALLSPAVRDRLLSEGFQLVNYHQIKTPNSSKI